MSNEMKLLRKHGWKALVATCLAAVMLGVGTLAPDPLDRSEGSAALLTATPLAVAALGLRP